MKKTNWITTRAILATAVVPGTVMGLDAFDNEVHPLTSPTIFDSAVPKTQARLIYLNQNHPQFLNTTAGRVAADGDFNLYALQFEYALDERTSIVALKDGYIDFNPEGTTLTKQEGFANLGAGIKRALIYQPGNGLVVSGIASLEFPTGDSEVWQGNGDGALNLGLAGLKSHDRWQFAGNAGLHIPFDDAQALTGSISLHASYEVSPLFIPVVEFNWFRTFDAGDGTSTFDDQGGNLVANVARFEGGDLINLGAANADDNRDTVILGAGFRSRISEQITLGFSYEFPLTDEEDGLMDDRLTIDAIWRF